MVDRFRVDYVNAVKENEMRKAEEEKKNKRDLAKKAAEEAKAKKGLKRTPASTTHLLNDESEDVIETMLETLQSGGGNQVLFYIISKMFKIQNCDVTITHILANQLYLKRKNTSLIFYTSKVIIYFMLKTVEKSFTKI